jgi:hypothetical protein
MNDDLSVYVGEPTTLAPIHDNEGDLSVKGKQFSYAPLSQVGELGLRKIVKVRFVGYRRMYDLEVSHPKHNFLLPNGVVTSNSETILHFYPEDRKRLYRANKYLARHPKDDINEEEMLGLINTDCEKKADTDTMRNLLQAAGVVSVDTRPPVDDEKMGSDNISRIAAPDESRPDCAFEIDESMQLMFGNIRKLSLTDQKLLRLKGIEFEVQNAQ